MITLYNKRYNVNNNNQHIIVVEDILLTEMNMREKKKYGLYVVICVLLLGVAYTACKDITPKQETITTDVELKLNK